MVAIVLSQVLNNNLVPDCNLRGSKFKIFLGDMPPDPPSGHVCMSGLSHATISSCYHPVFPLQLKILYETLRLLPTYTLPQLRLGLRWHSPSLIPKVGHCQKFK